MYIYIYTRICGRATRALDSLERDICTLAYWYTFILSSHLLQPSAFCSQLAAQTLAW